MERSQLCLALAVVAAILTAIVLYKHAKKEQETYSACADPLVRSFNYYKCLGSQPGFQEYCVEQVLNNGTVSPLIAEQMCRASDPYIWSVPYNL